MTLPRENGIPNSVRNAEETLRLLARVPAPEGLVERVQASLQRAPRGSFLTRWSGGFGLNGWMYSPALRGMAAAAIVVLVVGGGWRIYSHVQPAPTAKVIVMPARVGNGGALSTAGAMRRPDTLNGPVLAPAQPKPKVATPAPKPASHKKKAAGGAAK